VQLEHHKLVDWMCKPPTTSHRELHRRIQEVHYAWEGFDIEKMRADLNELPH
jgi:hypothetical protein